MLPPGPSPTKRAATARLVCALFARPGVRRARAILPQARRWSPDLVIHDLTDPAGAEVGALLGVPAIVHGTSPYAARQVVELTQVCAEFAAALMLPDRYTEILAAPFIDPFPASLQPAGPLPFTDVRRVRPEIPAVAPGERLPLRMQRFPHERTVLLTLGAGLARPDALLVALQVLRDFPVNVVVETGSRVEVAQLGRQPVQIAAAQRLPLAKVLPLCTAVISPGGAEEVLGALAYGLPQVCLPRTLDQRHSTAAVTATGAAIGVAARPAAPGRAASRPRRRTRRPLVRPRRPQPPGEHRHHACRGRRHPPPRPGPRGLIRTPRRRA